jgi:hypothetical protein
MYALSASELKTLSVIANPECCDAMPRLHLEKLYRLDLIEPASFGPALSPTGREILKRRRNDILINR